MLSPLEKALAVINHNTTNALKLNDNKKSRNNYSNNSSTVKPPRTFKPKPQPKQTAFKNLKPSSPSDKQYQDLRKHGYVYSTNQLAKYVYNSANNNDSAKAKPRRRVNKFINLPHNHRVLALLGNGKVPFINYRGKHYHYVNALQLLYIIARRHKGVLVGLREALASVTQSIITGGISCNAVIRFAKSHRGISKHGNNYQN